MSFIDAIVYARLSDDATIYNLANSIQPQREVVNPEPPYLTYSISNTDTDTYLDYTVSSIQRHTIDIQIVALHKSDLTDLSQAVLNLMHGWRGGQVRWSRLLTQLDIPLEVGYGRQLQFLVIQDDEVISRLLEWTRGADEIVTLRNLTNSTTGQLVTNATVSATIYEEDETTVVTTFGLPYTSTPGKYQATVDDSITSTMSHPTYRLKVVAVQGSTTKPFWTTIRMQP
jgi:hypothetical protein